MNWFKSVEVPKTKVPPPVSCGERRKRVVVYTDSRGTEFKSCNEAIVSDIRGLVLRTGLCYPHVEVSGEQIIENRDKLIELLTHLK